MAKRLEFSQGSKATYPILNGSDQRSLDWQYSQSMNTSTAPYIISQMAWSIQTSTDSILKAQRPQLFIMSPEKHSTLQCNTHKLNEYRGFTLSFLPLQVCTFSFPVGPKSMAICYTDCEVVCIAPSVRKRMAQHNEPESKFTLGHCVFWYHLQLSCVKGHKAGVS